MEYTALDGRIKIINCDCMDYMKTLDDNAFGYVITDVPYGKGNGTVSKFGKEKKRRKKNWDKERPSKKYFDEMMRVSDTQIIFGYNYFSDLVKPTRSIICWDKVGGYKFDNPFAPFELAWTSTNEQARKYTIVQQGFISEEKDYFHVTQKPVKLFGQIMNDYCGKGKTILDPYSGSATTAIAAILTGNSCVCCEKDIDYFNLSVERVKTFLEQQDLFIG